MANTNQWCVPDEMHDALVVDFDRSLSSLDMDLGASSNSVNTAVFAVPDISSSRRDENKSCLNTSAVNTVRCHQHLPNDVVSNEKCQIDCYPVNVVHGKKIRFSQLTDIDYSNTVKRFCVSKDVENSDDLHMSRCRPHSLSAPEMRAATGHHYSMGPMINTVFSQVVQFPALPPPQTMEHENYFGATSLFHYILMASTAISSRVHEETLTYLNQDIIRKCSNKTSGYPVLSFEIHILLTFFLLWRSHCVSYVRAVPKLFFFDFFITEEVRLV